MKKLLLFLCIGCGISLQAQQLIMDFSPAGDVENDASAVHKYGNKFYTNKTDWGKMQFAYSANLKKVRYGVELTQYDGQLKKLKVLSIDNEKNDLGPFSPMVHYGKSAIYVMYFKFVDEDKIKMYVAKVNPDDLSVVATQEIMEYDQKNQAFWSTVKTIQDTQTFYTVSEDGKQTLIVHASPSLIQASVIDADLKLVQKTESVPVKLDKLLITGAYIGNDGNKAVVYQYKDPGFKEFDTRGVFYQPANENGSFQTIKFPGGYFPGNLALKLSKDGRKVYIGGEYYNEEYDDAGKGVLLGEVNIKAQSVSTPVFYPYTTELKQRVLDLDFATKKKSEIVFKDHQLNYEINEMDNGTIVLSADMETTSGSMEHPVTFTGPVVHVFIKPGGKISMTLIPKKQPASSYTGFLNHIIKDKLICIYVDLPKFQEKEFEDKQIGLVRGVGGLVPVANIYDAEGKLLSRKMLVDSKKGIKGNVEIGYGSKIADNKFLFLVTALKANMMKYYTSVNQICYLEIL